MRRCILLLSIAAAGIQSSTAAPPPPASQPVAEAASAPSDEPLSLIRVLPDYSGDIGERRYLTGDWGGARTTLAEHGVLFDMDLTQWLQGNGYGGRDTNNAFRYSGAAEYELRLDTARMKMWPGGLITLRGETKFGDSINPKAGAMMAPNYQSLIPIPGHPGYTTLSEFHITQALSEKFVIRAGKMDLSTGDDNAFAHDQRTQFSNLALRINPVLFNAAPYTTMAVAAIAIPTDWLTIATIVADNDPDGDVTQTGFNTAFHGRDWYSVMQEYTFTLKLFEQVGHQRLGWFYTTRDFSELGNDSDSRLQLPYSVRSLRLRTGLLPRRLDPRRLLPKFLRLIRLGTDFVTPDDPDTRPDDWGWYYNFDQFLYTDPTDPKQGWGVFGRLGWSNGKSNLIEGFYSAGIGGTGLVPCRERDTWGIGYYHMNVSDSIRPFFGLHSEQGVEAYYNIEVTPWLHITPDVQVIIDPGAGFGNHEPAIVYGIRAQVNL